MEASQKMKDYGKELIFPEQAPVKSQMQSYIG